MDTLPFLVMTDQQAAQIREATAGDPNRLEPRQVDAGPHAGMFVLPERVTLDTAYEQYGLAFRLLPTIEIDTDLAWPPTLDTEE